MRSCLPMPSFSLKIATVSFVPFQRSRLRIKSFLIGKRGKRFVLSSKSDDSIILVSRAIEVFTRIHKSNSICSRYRYQKRGETWRNESAQGERCRIRNEFQENSPTGRQTWRKTCCVKKWKSSLLFFESWIKEKWKNAREISKHAEISYIIVKRDFPFPLPSRNYESNDRRNYEAFNLPGIPWRTNFIVQVFKILVKSDRAHRAAIPSSAPILTESRVSIVHGLRLIKRPNPARSNPRPIIPPLPPFEIRWTRGER